MLLNPFLQSHSTNLFYQFKMTYMEIVLLFRVEKDERDNSKLIEPLSRFIFF